MDSTNRIVAGSDEGDVFSQLSPNAYAGRGVEGSEIYNTKEGYDINGDGSITADRTPSYKNADFFGLFEGQGYSLNGMNLASQNNGYSTDYSYFYMKRGIFSFSDAEVNNVVLNNVTLVNNYFVSPYNEPVKDIGSSTAGNVTLDANVSDYNGLIASHGQANINNMIINGVDIYVDAAAVDELNQRTSILITDNKSSFTDILVQNINVVSIVDNKLHLALLVNEYDTLINNLIVANSNFQGNFLSSVFMNLNWNDVSPEVNNTILDYNYNDYGIEKMGISQGPGEGQISSSIDSTYSPVLSEFYLTSDSIEVNNHGDPFTFLSNNLWYNSNMGYSLGKDQPLQPINDVPGINPSTTTTYSDDHTIRGEEAKSYDNLNDISSYNSSWNNWNVSGKKDGYYPQLKTNWGMLMEQDDAPITDSLSTKVREIVDNSQEEGEIKPSDTTDVSSMQKSSNVQNDLEQSALDKQDETIKEEDEIGENLADNIDLKVDEETQE